MKQIKSFSVKERSKRFTYAFQGIVNFFRSEHNATLHLIATIGVIVLATIIHIAKIEVIALIFSIGFTWTAELFNTAIEKIMDFISEDKHPKIKFIKDLSAAAVLIAAVTAFITGCLVFIPKL